MKIKLKANLQNDEKQKTTHIIIIKHKMKT